MVLPPLIITPAFAVDLFLVGSNSTVVSDLQWLDPKKENVDSPIQATLRPALTSLVSEKRAFMVIDGGDGSLFPKPEPWTTLHYATGPWSETTNSMTETVTNHGKTKTRVLAQSTSTTQQWGGIIVGENGQQDYISATMAHFGHAQGHPYLAFMDLNSARTVLKSGQESNREELRNALLFSRSSLRDTQTYFAKSGSQPSAPVLCRTGIPRANDGSITCFPPAGVVGHYRLVKAGQGWQLEFVEFLRTSR